MHRVLLIFLLLTLSISLMTCGTGKSNSGNNTGGSSGPGAGGSGGTGGSGGGSGGSGGGVGGSGTGGSGSSSAVSFVYTAGANAINGYAVNTNGTLTEVPNSPYSSSTDTYIVTNGSNVYTVDSNGTELKIYSINKSNGALTLANITNVIRGNPNTADLVDYASLDHTGTSLYIGEFDSSGDDGVNFFRVGSNASASEVAYDGSSEVFGPPLVFSPNNKYGYSGNCYHVAWTIFSYTRSSDGTLSPPNLNTGANGPPVAIMGDFYCPMAFAVSSKGFLAIAYTDLSSGTMYMIGTYTINSDGTLTPVANSQATTASTFSATTNQPIAIDFDPTGIYLAVAGNGGVQTYSLDSGGILSPASSPQAAGVSFQNVEWDKSDHVFVTSTSQLYVWNVTTECCRHRRDLHTPATQV